MISSLRGGLLLGGGLEACLKHPAVTVLAGRQRPQHEEQHSGHNILSSTSGNACPVGTAGSPQRVPIIRPSSGVKPIVVSMDRPPATAHMLLPAPAQVTLTELRKTTGSAWNERVRLGQERCIPAQSAASQQRQQGEPGQQPQQRRQQHCLWAAVVLSPRWHSMRLHWSFGLPSMRAASCVR